MIHSVLKSWIFTLPYRMQSVLILGLRGCDTARKDDNSKFIQRALRSLVLNNADPTNTFILGDGIPDEKYVNAFLWDLDSYPLHFVMHTAHAAEIVGYKHPDEKIADWWFDFYKKLVVGLHLNYETEEQIDVRLGYTPAEQKDLQRMGSRREPQPEPEPNPRAGVSTLPPNRWDAGTGTSHGNRREKKYKRGAS